MRRSLLAVAALLLAAFALVAADPQTISATRRAPRSDVSVANPDVYLDLQLSAAPVNRTVFRVVCRVDNNGIPLSSLIGGPGVSAAVANNQIVPVAADITLAAGTTTATVTFRPSTTGAESPLCVFTFVSGDAAFTGAIDTVLVKVDPPVLGLTGFDTTDGLKLDVGYLPTLTLHTLSVSVATTFQVTCSGAAVYFNGAVTVPVGANSVSFTFTAGSELPVGEQTCVASWTTGDQRLISSTLSYEFDFVEARVTRTYFGLFGYCDELLKAVSGDQHTVLLTSSSVVNVATSVNATCVPVGCAGGCPVPLAAISNIAFNGTFAAGSTNASLVLNTPYLPVTPTVNYVCSFSVVAGSGDGRLNKPVAQVHELNLLVELANIRAVKPATGAVGDVIVVNSLQSAIFSVSLTHVVVIPGLTLQTVCSVPTSAGTTVNSGIITLAQFHEETFQSTFAFTGTINGTHTCVISYLSTAPNGGLNPATDDVRFALASYTFTVQVVATSLTFATDKASYQPNTAGVVSLTANEVFQADTAVSISCPGAGVFAKNAFLFTAGSNQLVQTISFKASVIPGVHVCVLVIGASTVAGDVRYSNVQIGGVLSITIVAPTLHVSACDYGSLTAGSTKYLTLSASQPVLADFAAEFRCTFTPAATTTLPPNTALFTEGEGPTPEAAITNPNASPVLSSTVYWYIKAGGQLSQAQPAYLTGLKVPNGFVGQASCLAVIVSTPDQRFNSSVFWNGSLRSGAPLPIPVVWNVTLPKYELISTGIADFSYLPAGSTQTITLRVNDPATNAPFVLPLGGLINVTAQCTVQDPTTTDFGNTVLGSTLDAFASTYNFLITGGKSSVDVQITLPSKLTTGLPAQVLCYFQRLGSDAPLAVSPVATGLGADLNDEYSLSTSADAFIEPLEFYVAPPTLVLSSNADSVQESGSNFVVSVVIDDGIPAAQDVIVTVECISGQLDHPRFDELPVLIQAGSASGQYINRITQLGPQVCTIQVPQRKVGDNTTLVGRVTDASGALLGPSRLQFAGPKKDPVTGAIAQVRFLAVSASLTLGAGLADKSLLAVGLPVSVTLTSSIPTDRYSANVSLSCNGQKLNFFFAAGGATSATASFTPSNKTGTFSCAFASTSPKSIDSADQPFIDIVLKSTTYTVFVPVVSVTGIADGEFVRAGSQTFLQLRTNALVTGSVPLRVAMTCSPVTNYAGQAFEFYVTAGQVSATSTAPFVAPTLPVNNTVCTLAYVSGDVRFAAAISAVAPLHISVTSVWSTLTVSPSGVVHPGQELTFNVALSEAAHTTTVFVFSCAINGAAGVAPQNIVVLADTTTDSETYTLPTQAGSGVCTFAFVSGDVRFQRQAPSSYAFSSVALPTSSSSSSTGSAQEASSSSGEDAGANGGSSSSSSGPVGGTNNNAVETGSPNNTITGGAAAAITIGVVIGAIIIGIGGYFAVTAIVAASATAAAAGGAAAAGAGGAAVAAAGSGAAAVSAAPAALAAAPAAAAAAAPAAASQAAHVAIGIGGF